MSARLTRRLAHRGWRVVQKDLRGCGDSGGEFRDATWSDWRADLQAEVDAAAPGPLWLWGVRAGALLAAELAARRANIHLLLWQPVVSGAQHLQQFLRLHAGARIAGASKGGDVSPAQALRAGTTVEIGGYELGAALAAGLEKASFDLPEGYRGRVVWLEVASDVPAGPSPAALREAERLGSRDIAVEHETVLGPPFWQTQEIEDCEPLLECSLARIEQTGAPRAQLSS